MEKKKYSIKDLFKIARGEGPSCSCSKTNRKKQEEVDAQLCCAQQLTGKVSCYK